MPKHPVPYCHACGSHDLTATSSQQMIVRKGKKRQAADVSCNACDNSWWSIHPTVRKMARDADRAREHAVA